MDEPLDHFEDLRLAASGDLNALHRLMPVIYPELRRIAAKMLQRDRAAQWVGADSLVHKAYLKLCENPGKIDFADRARIIGLIATIMRKLVIDVVRAATAEKRGGGATRVSLHPGELSAGEAPIDALEIEDALVALNGVLPESARVAELRLWGGMELPEIAAALDLPFSRVRALWNHARAWLSRELRHEGGRSA